jgi:serine/threonine protein kinase
MIIILSTIVGVAVLVLVAVQVGNAVRRRDGPDMHQFIRRRYEVLRELGRGGFGVVFLAKRRADGMQCALKVISCNSDEDVRSALSEFRLIRRAMPHRGMVTIYDIHVTWDNDTWSKREGSATAKVDKLQNALDEGQVPILSQDQLSAQQTRAAETTMQQTMVQQQVCIAMEFFSDGDLASFIRAVFERGECLQEAWLLNVLAVQLFEVLAHLHGQTPAIVHRDLKPENILMAEAARRIVVTDFGLAIQSDRSYMTTRAGSFHYLAPECWSHRYTESVDVWSAGCILYAAATGCVAPPTARVMFNDVRHPTFASEIRADLQHYSPFLSDVILSLLQLDPLRRPTAAQVLQTLRSAQGGSGGSERRQPSGEQMAEVPSLGVTPEGSSLN